MNTKHLPLDSRVWPLADLLSEAGLAHTLADPDSVVITALCDDSRTVVPGSLFVAVQGEKADGHDYIEHAINAGASAIVVQGNVVDLQTITLAPSIPLITVADSHEAIANLAATFYGLRSYTNLDSACATDSIIGSDSNTSSDTASSAASSDASSEPQALACAEPPTSSAFECTDTQPSRTTKQDQSTTIKLIGITGTNGKTTVAWLIRAILSHAKHKCALFGTIEYDLGDRKVAAPLTTPGAIVLCKHLAQARDTGVSHAILEVSSHALSQRRTAGLSFDVGVFTNLSGDHLDYHGSMDAYWRAKRRLFESLGESAIAVVNYDDPAADLMVSGTSARVVRYGLTVKNLDVSARIDQDTLAGSQFRLFVGQDYCDVNTSLLGEHNVANILAAAAVASVLGVSLEVTKEALESFAGTPGRLERVSAVDSPCAVFVDYAHTDEALRNVLATLKPLTSGRLIVVFGCGGDRDKTKRPRMAQVAASLADVMVVTSDNPRAEDPLAIIDDIMAGFDANQRNNVDIEPDRRLAIEKAIGLVKPGDTVLIAGKGHENYQLVGDTVLEFDDAIVARNYLEQVITDSALS